MFSACTTASALPPAGLGDAGASSGSASDASAEAGQDASGSSSRSGSSGTVVPVTCPAGDAGGDPPDPGAGATCPTPINASLLPWKEPTKKVGSCTQAEFDAFVALVNANGNAKYSEWKASVTNPTCASCIFGKATDMTWAPMLEDASGTVLQGLNVGGCIAIATGKSPSASNRAPTADRPTPRDAIQPPDARS